MEIVRSCKGYSGPAWCPDSSEEGEATFINDAGGAEAFLDYMLGDHQSADDLFELVRRGGGGRRRGESGTDQAQHCLPLPHEPPSEDEMAAWLYPIVRGEVEPATSMDQPACGDDVNGTSVTATNSALKTAKCTESTGSDPSVRRKPTAEGRRSHRSETHNLTEKKRRWKINEKFKTLQQLVPGCDKCNQASILDQTIKYMKTLQRLVQDMATGCSMRLPSAAVYPVVHPTFPAPAAVTTTGGLPPPPPAAIAPGLLVPVLVPWPQAGGVLAQPAMPMATAPFPPMLPAVMLHAAPMLRYPENVVPNAAAPPAARNQD